MPLVPSCQRLLDVGGGNGATALELKRTGRCASAGVVDLVAPLDRGLLDFSLRGDLSDPDLLRPLAQQYGPFDTVLCLDILEHLAEPEVLLARLVAALRPGGTLIASIPNVRHVSVLAPLLFSGRWDYADSGVLDRTHLRFFVRSSAVALLAQAGLHIAQVVPSGFGTRYHRLANALTFGLLRDFFTIQYFIVAQKPAGI